MSLSPFNYYFFTSYLCWRPPAWAAQFFCTCFYRSTLTALVLNIIHCVVTGDIFTRSTLPTLPAQFPCRCTSLLPVSAWSSLLGGCCTAPADALHMSAGCARLRPMTRGVRSRIIPGNGCFLFFIFLTICLAITASSGHKVHLAPCAT